ncbi:MAG: type II toxin-antitoxin system RelE/ParE family toxin [Rhodanobacteraceae bacterium]
MRVVWTDRAKARLRQIHGYIAKDQPLNADRVVDRLTQRAGQLVEHPLSGRIVEEYRRDGLRELIEPPWRIVYLILPERIDIITVRDTRRILPRHLDEL